jgi:hypothetical protein
MWDIRGSRTSSFQELNSIRNNSWGVVIRVSVVLNYGNIRGLRTSLFQELNSISNNSWGVTIRVSVVLSYR